MMGGASESYGTRETLEAERYPLEAEGDEESDDAPDMVDYLPGFAEWGIGGFHGGRYLVVDLNGYEAPRGTGALVPVLEILFDILLIVPDLLKLLRSCDKGSEAFDFLPFSSFVLDVIGGAFACGF